MNAPTELQVIKGPDGGIQYVVLPYAEFLRLRQQVEPLIPNEVAGKVLVENLSPIHAWREYLGLTDAEVAARIQVSPAAFAELEAADARPRKSILRRVAVALGLSLEQLDF